MKKLVSLILFSVFVCMPAFCDDAEDLWNNYGIDVRGGQEQNFVTDEDFEKAIEQVDAKVNKWKNWAERRKRPKGQEFSQSNETEILRQEHGEDVSLPVISLPVDIKIGDDILPVGHYQVKGENTDGNVVLNIYQAGNLMTKIPAVETNEDFEQEEILFVNWLPEDEDKIKIIYGSLDFNAFAVVDTAKNNSF